VQSDIAAPPVHDFDGAFQAMAAGVPGQPDAPPGRTSKPSRGRGPMTFDTKRVSREPGARAPDGSEVRILCRVGRGGMAHFTLPPMAVSRAVAHQTVEEVWFFISRLGRMWRRLGGREEIVEVGPGTSISIPVGTHFQFRSDGYEPLAAVGCTMPPWPGEDEAYAVDGPWQATA
jgi:mannose-6-phosphate isomerase-like protein (cupin superfamily)